MLVVLLVLLLGAGLGYGGWWYASGRYSHVPSVTGDSPDLATQALVAAGYTVRIQPGPMFDPTVKAGLVLRTSPAAGTRLVRGKTVLIILSAGPHYYLLPAIGKNQTPDQVRATLEAIGPVTVVAQPKNESSDTVPAGYVTRIDPPAGSKVVATQPITIYVSTGPPIIAVPPIAQGTPFDQAKQTLTTAGFQVKRVDEFSDAVGKDDVIVCTPSTQAPKFSPITCTVSKGPQMVHVPDIVPGEAVSDAQAAITAAGLVPQVNVFTGGQPGTVLAVKPDPGTLVASGSTVIIYALPG
jgi:serine/threonine-protein kinase